MILYCTCLYNFFQKVVLIKSPFTHFSFILDCIYLILTEYLPTDLSDLWSHTIPEFPEIGRCDSFVRFLAGREGLTSLLDYPPSASRWRDFLLFPEDITGNERDSYQITVPIGWFPFIFCSTDNIIGFGFPPTSCFTIQGHQAIYRERISPAGKKGRRV